MSSYSVFDILALSDSLDQFNVGLNLSDNFALSDSFDGRGFSIEFDGIGLSDAIVAFEVVATAFNDSLSLTDSVGFTTFHPSLLVSSDSLNLFDSVQLSAALDLALSDTNSLSDAAFPGPFTTFDDSFILSDGSTVSLNSIFVALTESVGDSVVPVDSIQLFYQAGAVLGDSNHLTDQINVVLRSDIKPYLRRYLNDVERN